MKKLTEHEIKDYINLFGVFIEKVNINRADNKINDMLDRLLYHYNVTELAPMFEGIYKQYIEFKENKPELANKVKQLFTNFKIADENIRKIINEKF